MDWILDNIQFVIAFIAAFVWWLNKRREQGAAADEEAPPPMMMGDPDHDEAERARRIQEEIRRKIAERRTLPPVAPPPMLMREREPREGYSESIFDPRAAVLEQQRQLDGQLRMIEETRRKADAIRAQVTAVPTRASVPARPRATPSRLIGDLRGAASLRRAIVLREILGPPKGLQN